MDVRIGLTNNPKELEISLGEDADADARRDEVEAAIGAGGTLWLTDRRGRRIAVPVDRLAYVEIGSPQDDRRIGFGS